MHAISHFYSTKNIKILGISHTTCGLKKIISALINLILLSFWALKNVFFHTHSQPCVRFYDTKNPIFISISISSRLYTSEHSHENQVQFVKTISSERKECFCWYCYSGCYAYIFTIKKMQRNEIFHSSCLPFSFVFSLPIKNINDERLERLCEEKRGSISFSILIP